MSGPYLLIDRRRPRLLLAKQWWGSFAEAPALLSCWGGGETGALVFLPLLICTMYYPFLPGRNGSA